ncbi:hypothetical protein B0H67DRAFT_608933 [Lasiosphaeris hirsuta]|uniref:AA1-like domain-containing protein n=1 Tax=Lasiosphaeris hirsuta TaxID=260670 RepID=A0AA40E2I0_9PEZI|nr:hypothetical protein B0H67DRAFT_608933 [Lasiosphaeris hirsuta]
MRTLILTSFLASSFMQLAESLVVGYMHPKAARSYPDCDFRWERSFAWKITNFTYSASYLLDATDPGQPKQLSGSSFVSFRLENNADLSLSLCKADGTHGPDFQGTEQAACEIIINSWPGRDPLSFSFNKNKGEVFVDQPWETCSVPESFLESRQPMVMV